MIAKKMLVDLIVGEFDVTTLDGLETLTGEKIDYENSVLVNPTNPYLYHEGGVAKSFVKRGGKVFQEDSTNLLRKFGETQMSGIVVQKDNKNVYNFPAKTVFNLVCPAYDESEPTFMLQKLKEAYTNALVMAEELKIKTIAFPALSIRSFPQVDAARCVREVFEVFPFYNIQRVVLCYREGTVETFMKASGYKPRQTIETKIK